MRLLGIDFGEKRVGLALSDDKGMMAFPHSVIPNTKNLLLVIAETIRRVDAKKIIVGESRDYKGKENRIMDKAKIFVDGLRMAGYEVIWESELLTSHQAAHFQGKTDMTDAAAASIILQSYIDRTKNSNN